MKKATREEIEGFINTCRKLRKDMCATENRFDCKNYDLCQKLAKEEPQYFIGQGEDD